MTGRTADEILTFIGDSLSIGFVSTALPRNPNSASDTGVIIEGQVVSDIVR